MYFESRSQAGKILADQLVAKYRYENCAVVALSNGGVVVGEQIAAQLHCVLMLLVSQDIEIPGEGMNFGAVSQTGDFTYNDEFSAGEIDEYTSEFHGYLAEKRRETYSSLNRLISDGGTVVVLVSDGFANTASVGVALDFLKPIRILRLVVASPVASVAVVDRLHITADELHLLDVKENFLGVDHYYEDNNVPTLQQSIDKISQIILNWR